MSFDLAVWHSDALLSDREAEEIYLKLCEDPALLKGENASVAAFYRELTQKWPEIDTVPEDKVGDFDFCPWSCELSRSGMVVLTCCVWSMADSVSEFVMDLAYKHELVCFDPQSQRVVLPASLLAKGSSNHQVRAPASRPGFFSRLFGRRSKN